MHKFWIFVYQQSSKKKLTWVCAVVWCLLLIWLSLTISNIGTFPENEILNARINLDTERGFQTQSFLAADDSSPEHYDILINSYQRSGSSFMGQLLAFNPDTFYWYEPFWCVHGLLYYMERFACIGNSTCGDFGRGDINSVNQRLGKIYSCNFTDLVDVVAENMTAKHSGAVWKPFLSCKADGQSTSACLKIMEDVCTRSRHRATKIVRLTVDNLEYILERNANLKAIHLIRDPRAIINSHLTTKWYKIEESKLYNLQFVKWEAEDLCVRMKYDLKMGEKLKQKYPHRFAFAMYEDLQNDLIFNTEKLYSYFGINQSAVRTKAASIPGILQEDHTIKRTLGDYTNWWRHNLQFNAVKVVDQVCKDVLLFLGYKIFSSENEIRNLTNKAYSLRKDLLINSLYYTRFYDFKSLNKQKPYIRKIDIIPEYGNKIKEQKTMVI